MRFIFFLCSILLCFSLRGEEKSIIRIGYFRNITHAQALIGKETKWFEKKLGPDIEIQWYTYPAGPGAMEGIFTDALDLCYAGPNPTINAYVRSEKSEVKILCGACSGGAALVIHPHSDIKFVEDFRGKKIATPQLGSTQDIAARSWFKSKGFNITLMGGDIQIIPTANAQQLMLFSLGQLDGVWTVEPWVSQLKFDAGGVIYLHEKSIWPKTGGRYITTQLVGREEFLKENPELVKKWIAAHVELTIWIQQHSSEAKTAFNTAFAKEMTKPLSQLILNHAWDNLEFTYDPIPASLMKDAEEAYALGFLPRKPDLKNIYDLSLLNAILKEKGLQPL